MKNPAGGRAERARSAANAVCGHRKTLCSQLRRDHLWQRFVLVGQVRLDRAAQHYTLVSDCWTNFVIGAERKQETALADASVEERRQSAKA
jgi:hypothetical protein